MDWIYGEGQSASKDVYKDKLAQFKAVGMPVKSRAAFHADFPVFMDQFQQLQQEVNDKLAQSPSITD